MTFKKLAILHDCVTCKKKDSLLKKKQIYSIEFLACPASMLTLYIVVIMHKYMYNFIQR